MTKTLDVIAQERGLNTWQKLLSFIDGKKVKTLKKRSGHNYPESFVVSIKSNYDSYKNNTTISNFTASITLGNIVKGSTSTSGIYLDEIIVVGNSVNDFKEELKELYKEENDLKIKIDLMEKFELEEFDDLMLKAYKIYQNLDCSTADQFKSIYKSLL